MICASCGEREASVFLSRSSGGESSALALCEACARRRGLSAGLGKIEINIEDLLLAPRGPEGSRPADRCPSCGLSLDELRREGRIGCPACAEAFRSELERRFSAKAEAPFFRDEAFNASQGAAGPAPALPLAQALGSGADFDAASDALVERSLLSDLALLGRAEAARQAGRAAGGELPPGLDESSEVVLWTEARLSRNFSGGPFSEARLPSLEGLSSAPLERVSEPVKRALVESSRLSRNYAFERGSVLAVGGDGRLCFLLGKADQLCALARLPGPRAAEALALAKGGIEGRSWSLPFAFDPEFGYLSSRAEGCGSGLSLSAELHLPALAASGLLEKALRSLMAAGFAVRGFYGSDSGSAGELYEIGTDWSYGARAADMASSFGEALRRLAESEARARRELARAEGEALLDGAGRALGILGGCRYLDAVEAAGLLSALRLAALSGLARGAEPGRLGLFMRALGPASLSFVARKAGFPPLAAQRRGEDRLRASFLARLCEGVTLIEGGTPCSKA